MKVIVIYGSMRKGSTYNCVQVFFESIKDKITDKREFFLSTDMPHFCKGCFSCFINGEQTCPHYKEMKLITKALEDADLIILASPVYVSDVSGQMKSFLDHLAYRWMVHRPHPEMFKKIGLVISTAAGAGTRTTNKTMKRSLVFWGVNKVYSYGVNIAASRELVEETGAKDFKIYPVSIYSVLNDGTRSFGQLFYAEVKKFNKLPDFEIGEIKLFNSIPENLTYPLIQPQLFREVINTIDT